MSRRTVIQSGSSSPCDLFVYCHIEGSYIRDEAHATRDAVVSELWGNGTAIYKAVLAAYRDSWAGYVANVETQLGKKFRRTCLTTWSAGSQVAKTVCVHALKDPTDVPDAIVMLDGLYGSKPAGSLPGDGKVVFDETLKGLAEYGARAARGERIMVITHSNIPTSYASSKECATAVRKEVERIMGAEMAPAALEPDALGHGFKQALQLGNFTVIEFAGKDAAEHIANGHLFDEVWSRFVPWATDEDMSDTDPAPPASAPSIDGTIADLALEISLAEEAAHVGENPPGSNKVKPEYWAGCTRLAHGTEALVGVDVGPWCAASFQWATYEAAKRLGLSIEPDAWHTGEVPHGKRISVIEIQNDMSSRGLFRPKAKVLAGGYDPKPGDAVFMDRVSGTGSDFGHIARFVRRIDTDTFESVGGNESPHDGGTSDAGDRWRKTVHRYDEKRVRGFGEFTHRAPPAQLDAATLDAMLRISLDRAIRDWMDRPRDSESA